MCVSVFIHGINSLSVWLHFIEQDIDLILNSATSTDELQQE